MLIFSVILLETSIQFVSNKIPLVLPWCNFGTQLYPCCFSKFLVHNKCDKKLFAATGYPSIYVLYWSSASLKWFKLLIYQWLIHLQCDFSYLHVPKNQHQHTGLQCLYSLFSMWAYIIAFLLYTWSLLITFSSHIHLVIWF